ncbi:flagellar hook protein FlgE [Sphingomonas oligophenolica]|uniref:Flagellar hook protein FlgE n=1 Tax=Sphingomonas oligophenolica TaxID=301154 RepID=A0A502CPV8_9SPHN|nr:flagellar hook protein FlgE [Sphingomonas oligophenolica]TPG15675.1 flagellar hook protein FlgE [Sphingomonas oligophenolica]
MSFYTSLSGLQASQTDMSVISHNLANVGTNGFKKSRSEFGDVIASSLASDPLKSVGSGVVVKANRQQFGEGNLKTTASGLDLAISGDGFFAVQTAGINSQVDYTRNGSFLIDPNRYVVDAQGSKLLVNAVDSEGNVIASGPNNLKPLQLPENSGKAVATTAVSLAVNLSSKQPQPTATFDRNDPASFNYSTATTVFDADGNPSTLANYYVRTKTGTAASPTSEWEVHSYIGDEELAQGGVNAPQKLVFDATGKLTSPTAPVQFDAVSMPGASAPLTLSEDFANTSQLTSAFQVIDRHQDGSAAGHLSGVSVNETGVVTASFSNGDSVAIGKIAVANFNNPGGLRQLGNSYWTATGVSGEPKLGSAGESGYGSLMTGTLEGSNVDITEELVALISAQRNFQANAKALDTANQISQTIFNIRS